MTHYGKEKIYKDTIKPICMAKLSEIMVDVMKEVNNLKFERRNYVAQMLLMERKCYEICRKEGILYDEGVKHRKGGS